jgi:hypothetical protein
MKEFTQIYRVHYYELFGPVAKLASNQLMLLVAPGTTGWWTCSISTACASVENLMRERRYSWTTPGLWGCWPILIVGTEIPSFFPPEGISKMGLAHLKVAIENTLVVINHILEDLFLSLNALNIFPSAGNY